MLVICPHKHLRDIAGLSMKYILRDASGKAKFNKPPQNTYTNM